MIDVAHVGLWTIAQPVLEPATPTATCNDVREYQHRALPPTGRPILGNAYSSYRLIAATLLFPSVV
jgi:hypothetical protein